MKKTARQGLLILAAVVASLAGVSSEARAGSSSGKYVVILKSDAGEPGLVAKQHESKFGLQAAHVYRHALRGYTATLPSNRLEALRSDERVLFVSEDREFSIAGQALPAGINRLDGDSSSTVSGNGSGSVNVNVAVLDVGLQTTHPDLNVVGGVDCTRGKNSFEADNSHGTLVGGIIGARDNAFGVVGIAPGTRLWSVKVLKKNGAGTLSTILCGVDWVTGTRADQDPVNDIAVANLSLGGQGSDDANCGNSNRDALHKGICRSVASGVTYAVAAANSPIDFRNSIPESYDEVLAVTGMADFDGQPGGLNGPICGDQDDTFTDFSAFATLQDDRAHTVTAPGVCIFSTTIGSQYGTGTGNSFAVPHVAGTVALCIATGPCTGLTPAQIVQKIVADAAAYNTANPSYGFTGDSLHSPDQNRYYGFLIRAGLY